MASTEPGANPGASDEETRQLRHWIERWRVVGPMLDDDRWARLAAASDTDLQRDAFSLLALCKAGVAGDDGESLVRQQRVFARLLEGERA